MKIEVSSKFPGRRSITTKEGKQFNLVVQDAALFFADDPWPIRFELSFREGSREPYAPGLYEFTSGSFEVERGRLKIAFDMILRPLSGAERTNLAPLKTGS